MSDQETPNGSSSQAPNGTQAQGSATPEVGERDRLFADIRRMVTGMVEQATKPRPEATPPRTTDTTAQPIAGMTPADVQRMIMRRDELADRLSGLPAEARTFLRGKFDQDNPAEIGPWVSGYTAAFGLRAGQPPTGNNTAQNPNVPPISDGGGPSRDTSLETSGAIWKMSAEEVQAEIRQKGRQATIHRLKEQVHRDMLGTKILMPR